jgi:metallo-beta-lactamase family protein
MLASTIDFVVLPHGHLDLCG